MGEGNPEEDRRIDAVSTKGAAIEATTNKSSFGRKEEKNGQIFDSEPDPPRFKVQVVQDGFKAQVHNFPDVMFQCCLGFEHDFKFLPCMWDDRVLVNLTVC